MKNKHKLGALALSLLLLVVLVVTLTGQLSANVNQTQNNSSQSNILSGVATFFGQGSNSQGKNTQEESQQEPDPQNPNPTPPGPQYKTCPTCKGEKTVVTGVQTRAPAVCDRCGGDGKIGDPWGYVWCKFCEGNGQIEYPPQEIRGTCPTCSGTGQIKA